MDLSDAGWKSRELTTPPEPPILGTALPFVQWNVRGPSLHLFFGLLYSASVAAGSGRKLWTGPTIFSPSQRLSPVVLAYYPRDVQQVLLHLNTWFLNKSTLTGWSTSISLASETCFLPIPLVPLANKQTNWPYTSICYFVNVRDL